MMPVAPARLSTTIGWPSSSVRRGATWRTVMSVGPPAENGTTMRIGFAGKDCAATAAGNRQAARQAAQSGVFTVDPPGIVVAGIVNETAGDLNRPRQRPPAAV